MYNLFTGQYTSNAKPGIGQTYFVVQSGASVTVKLKNISNAYAMPIEFYTTVGGAETKISSLQFSRFTNATDKTVTATFTTDQTIGGMWLYIVRTGRNAGNVFECDLEVYVDGDRWI